MAKRQETRFFDWRQRRYSTAKTTIHCSDAQFEQNMDPTKQNTLSCASQAIQNHRETCVAVQLEHMGINKE